MMRAVFEHAFARLAMRFFRFGIVGVIGYVIGVATLAVVMEGFGLGPYAGWFFCIAAAMAATWLLNRRFTFSMNTAPDAAEGARYALVKLLGLAVNFAIYSLIVMTGASWASPYIALAAATLVVMVMNFTLLSLFVFKAGDSLER